MTDASAVSVIGLSATRRRLRIRWISGRSSRPLSLSALTPWEEAAPARDELPEITMIARAGQKMSPERRQDMLRLLQIAFPEEFRDDDGA